VGLRRVDREKDKLRKKSNPKLVGADPIGREESGKEERGSGKDTARPRIRKIHRSRSEWAVLGWWRKKDWEKRGSKKM